ncbi:MAG: OmpH family outer membrane protein [Caenibius sp.]
MKNILKSAVAAGFLLSVAPLGAATATAQVAGIATADPSIVIAGSKARDAAYRQINQTYSAQITQLRQLETEMNGIKQKLDKNGDKQVDQQEYDSNPNVVQQMEAKQQQIAQTGQPIVLAQYYAIEQLINDYSNARDEVVKAKKISIILQPQSIQYAPDSVDVTADIIAAVDKRLPTVSTAVPAGWKPRRETVEIHQAVQQLMVAAAAQQRASEGQQASGPATSGR